MSKKLLMTVITLLFSLQLAAQEPGKTDQLYITFLKGTEGASPETTLEGLCARFNATSIPAFPLSEVERLQQTYLVKGAGDDLKEQLQQQFGDAVFIEDVPAVEPLYHPDDMELIPAIVKCGQKLPNYHLDRIRAAEAWELTKGSRDIKIAIIDQGFDPSHPDFINADGSNQVVFWDSIAAPAHHGTFVAGSAAAATDNGTGIAGIGFRSSLMLYTRLGDYSALYEAAGAGAQVINLSWGGLGSSVTQQLVIDEITAKGVVITAAAGNGFYGITWLKFYPASYNNVISVSSTGPADEHEYTGLNNCQPATFLHEHNDAVDLTAPGYDVVGLAPGGQYAVSSGTSFASPMVAGVIGLILAVNPDLKPDDVLNILKCGARNIDGKNPTYVGQLGAGRVDAFRSVWLATVYDAGRPPVARIEEVVKCDSPLSLLKAAVQGGAEPYSFSWTGDEHTNMLSVKDTGLYTVYVKDLTCRTDSFSYRVDTIYEPLRLKNSKTVLSACAGTTVNPGEELQIEGGSGQFSYSWFDDRGQISGEKNPFITIVSEERVSLKVADLRTGCTDEAVFHLRPLDDPACDVLTTNSPGDVRKSASEELPAAARGGQCSIYPNPFQGTFTLSMPENGQTQVKVYDGSGRLVKIQDVEGQQVSISLPQFAPGFYLVEVWQQGELMERVKLIGS